jgi:hypothetical protein
MTLEKRIKSHYAAQQTYGSTVPLAAALIGFVWQSAALARSDDANHSAHRQGFLAISDGRLESSNQAASIETVSGVDQHLASEMTRMFVQLAQSQQEMDAASKKILYRNRRQLYRR